MKNLNKDILLFCDFLGDHWGKLINATQKFINELYLYSLGKNNFLKIFGWVGSGCKLMDYATITQFIM